MPRLDLVLGACFAAYAAALVWLVDRDPTGMTTGVGGPAWVTGPCLVVAGAALAWRRVAPLPSCAAVCLAIAVQSLTGQAPEGLAVSGPAIIAVYSVAAYATGRAAVAGLVLALGAIVAHTVGDPLVRTRADVEAASFWWLVVVAAWIVGLAVHRHRQARELHETAVRLEHERDEAAARERTRMARELHDVVSHGVSVIALQAGAAQETLAGDPDRTRDRLVAIEQTARDSAAELRRMLGVLRDDDGPGERAPLPGLDDLPPLVENLRAAGLPVTLRMEGEAHVPSGVGLSAYRIVQEGLTNAVKHADPSHVDVLVRHAAGALELEVAHDGAGARSGDGGGFGLAGLRERVAVHGGTLEAAPRPGGAFVLRAHLPAESA